MRTVKDLQSEATAAKKILMGINNELAHLGEVKLGKSLSAILWKLEHWQHRKGNKTAKQNDGGKGK